MIIPQMGATGRFDSLQCFRGIAALGVLLFHSSAATNARIQPIPDWVMSLCSLGNLGVDFFFVLSGFIILTSHLNDAKTPGSARTYLTKRLVRIFPPYLPVSIALLVSLWLLPPDWTQRFDGPRPEFSLLSSLLLVPDYRPPALSIAWTLIFEMVFYFVFLLFFISNRVFVLAVVSWSAAIAFWIPNGNPLLDTVFDARNLEFILGMATACIARAAMPRSAGWILLAAGVLGIWLSMFAFPTSNPMILGAVFSAIVLGGVLLERQGQIRTPAFLVTLGDASYAIYLTHNPLQSAISRIFPRFVQHPTWWLGMSVAVIACVLSGILYHRRFEKPLVRAIGKL